MKKAFLYMVVSTLAFSLMNAFIKHLDTIPTFQIVFFRSIGTLVLATSFILVKGISIWGNNKKLLTIRGIVGVTSMSLFFASVKYLPIGTAVSLRYTAPIFATFFAVLWLKEQLKPLQWVLIFIAFSGVLVLKGFDATVNTTGLFLVLGSAVFSGLVYTIIRRIGKSEHPLVVVNYFMIVATLVGGLGCLLLGWQNPTSLELFLLLSLGIFGFIGQLLMTMAFQSAATNLVAPMKYFEAIYVLAIGVFWFGDVYTLISLLGIFMIIGALVANVFVGRKS